ncbi:hypothetical protein DIZ76_011803 [Coccidioides immitis]|nr:hypothetical protein DIZ76_011803 [Coccidioides immitis]
MTSMTAPGRFRDLMISAATDDFPDPELPAMPMMLMSSHGREHRDFVSAILEYSIQEELSAGYLRDVCD